MKFQYSLFRVNVSSWNLKAVPPRKNKALASLPMKVVTVRIGRT